MENKTFAAFGYQKILNCEALKKVENRPQRRTRIRIRRVRLVKNRNYEAAVT